jgi:hypothetical protein
MNEEVSAYIDTVSDERKPMYEKLQSLVVELYPDVRIVMTSQIPTYRAKSGWIGLGYSEKGVSLYTSGPQHLADFRKEHPDIKAGKNSVDFNSTEDIPEEAVRKIIRSAIEEPTQPRGRKRS